MSDQPCNLGQNILRLRIDKGMKQKELAKLAGVSQPLIARIESGGRHDMRCLHAHGIAMALGVTIDDLMRDPGIEKS